MQKLKLEQMKHLLVTLLIAGFGLGVQAQEDKKEKEDRVKISPEERAERHTKKMTETLKLDEKQVSEVSKINLEHAQKMEAYHTKMKALKKEMKAERLKTKEQIDALLTDEQKKIVEEKRAEKKQKKMERRQCCEKCK